MAETNRADCYREIADQLWGFSLDQREYLSFEARRRLAIMAEEFTALARRSDRKIAAD